VRDEAARDQKTMEICLREIERCQRTLEGHSNEPVNSVSVAPDSRRAVSAGHDHTLRVWDLETCACLAVACGDTPWTVAAVATSRLVAGASSAEVALLAIHGLETCS
jgi:WD40 repeat protein